MSRSRSHIMARRVCDMRLCVRAGSHVGAPPWPHTTGGRPLLRLKRSSTHIDGWKPRNRLNFSGGCGTERVYPHDPFAHVAAARKMLDRLLAYSRGGAAVADVAVVGSDLFYAERPADKERFRVVATGARRRPVDVLVDLEPTAFTSLDYFVPSPDGDISPMAPRPTGPRRASCTSSTRDRRRSCSRPSTARATPRCVDAGGDASARLFATAPRIGRDRCPRE